MTEIQKPVTLTGLTIVITSVFMITLGNNVFALDYSKYTNNKYGTYADNSNVIFLNWINRSIDQRDEGMIIPVGANFKDSNQAKINSCAQSYHNKIPKIYRDDESYREGSYVACSYGLYNYNVNIGNKELDPILRIQIEGEAEICMLDDHCMKKINQIIKGKIALPQSSNPTLKDSSSNIPPKPSPEEEEQKLFDFCVRFFYAVNQHHISCEDLKPELKQKIQIEAQKKQEKYKVNDEEKDDKDDDKKDKRKD